MSSLEKSKNPFSGLPVICFVLSALLFLYGLSFLFFPVDVYIWDDFLPFFVYGAVVLIVGLLVARSRKNKTQVVEQRKQNIAQSISGTAPRIADNNQKDVFKIFVPNIVGKEILVYKYNMVSLDLSPDAERLAQIIMESESTNLSVDVSKDIVTFSHSGIVFGSLSSGRLFDMISDFTNNCNTVKAWFQEYSENGGFVYLAFYQDFDKKYHYRESGVYKLSRYASNDIQDTVCFSSPGTVLEIEEDDEGILWVTYESERFGCLPKSASDKHLDEGSAAILLESVDYDEERGMYVPFVKIYW